MLGEKGVETPLGRQPVAVVRHRDRQRGLGVGAGGIECEGSASSLDSQGGRRNERGHRMLVGPRAGECEQSPGLGIFRRRGDGTLEQRDRPAVALLRAGKHHRPALGDQVRRRTARSALNGPQATADP